LQLFKWESHVPEGLQRRKVPSTRQLSHQGTWASAVWGQMALLLGLTQPHFLSLRCFLAR
jgi:hypothetical protein